ncbi:MAG TPA: cytochrome c peroxidase [Pirellulales bacterium]|nr:cytochrome c peroxidase [Pirellulales bacterium]
MRLCKPVEVRNPAGRECLIGLVCLIGLGCFVWLAMLGRLTAARAESPGGPPPLVADMLPAELPHDAAPLGLGPPPAPPAGNATTPERVRLGRKLFFDPRLSADGTVACASCHDPAHGFASAAPRAIGILGRVGTRNAPSLLNRAYGKSFFWDGRSQTLEDQALEPIANPLEMGAAVGDVVARLNADPEDRAAFDAAYAGGVTAENLGRALAAFERAIVSGGSRVDRFQAGEVAALNDSQRIGLWLFESRAQCWRCHRGPNYTDEKFHNTGVAALQAKPDAGRHGATHDEADRGHFKTPGLRDVSRTAPYMHDGSLATLRDVVEYYNRGGGQSAGLDRAIKPLGLSREEVNHLVAFLESLDGSDAP